MIERVGTVCIFFSDRDQARKFYTQVLGFKLRSDEPLFPGAKNRWLALRRMPRK